MNTCQRKPLDFPYALRSFIGYLEGTEKAAHTIKSYRLDLLCFESFLRKKHGGKPKLEQLTLKDLERFHEFLKGEGFKTNTRRRRLITARRFLGYLANRKKVPKELLGKLPTPQKSERIPKTVQHARLLEAVRGLSTPDAITERNKLMLWVMAETGCMVSEISKLRFDSLVSHSIRFEGKGARSVSLTPELSSALSDLRQRFSSKRAWVFPGFNRFGELRGPITSRGVELVVRFYQERLALGKLTPRTFRHSATAAWLASGASQDEVQKKLGLKSNYAFRAFVAGGAAGAKA